MTTKSKNYGNELLNFSRYYKYSFSFTKTTSNRTTIHVSVGENHDDIYDSFYDS